MSVLADTPVICLDRRVLARPDGAKDLYHERIGVWALVDKDYSTRGHEFASQGSWTPLWHRFGNWHMPVRARVLRKPQTGLRRSMSKSCEWAGEMLLPLDTPVVRRVKVQHFGGTMLQARAIDSDVVIGQDSTFGVATTRVLNARLVTHDRFDISAAAVIVGEGAIVSTNAVIMNDVLPGSVINDVPARLLKVRDA